MKNTKALVAMVSIAFVIAIGAMAGRSANAATPTVNLGTAASYSVLAGTPVVSNTGPTSIDRNLGIHPAAAVTGFPPGIVLGEIHTADAVALQAKSDLTVAYLDAASRGSTATYGALDGQTIVGGVYDLQSLAVDLTGVLTLDGANDPSSVWIFKAPSTLITASASSMLLIRGASPCNVFWQVTSSATLGSGSSFVGTIMALTSIHLTAGVTVQGRALARNGDVTLINDRFLTSACNAAPAPPPVVIPPTQPPFTIAPSATPAAVATATPIGTTAPTAAPAATPIAAATPAAATRPVSAVPGLPSTSTGDPLGALAMIGIGLTGVGLLLLRRPVRHS